jgi:serine/threonine protein kinase
MTFLYQMDRLKAAFSKDPCQKYYTLTRTLGQGSFATVKLAISKADQSQWAIKVRTYCLVRHLFPYSMYSSGPELATARLAISNPNWP